MLHGMIDDRTHAFGNGLILHHDVANAAIEAICALRFPIDLPIVAEVLHGSPAPEPVRCVGQIVQRIRAADARARL
jgi:hypothetical protein